MPPLASDAWRRRYRRLGWVAVSASTVYLLVSYGLDRMRQARMVATKDRERRDRIKSHFTTLLSTISFTLYALLPTLQPQLYDAYPVEATSQALQSLSATSSSAQSQASIDADGQSSQAETPESSLLLQNPNAGEGQSGLSESQSTVEQCHSSGGVGESWASEFQQQGHEAGEGGEEHHAQSTASSTASHQSPDTDDALSSTMSQSISLPPTDTSSASHSPPSDLSQSIQLHPSPPRSEAAGHGDTRPEALSLSHKSKKELWNDLKIQNITRALTTAYIIPMLFLLTTSQLSTLARRRYMEDVKSALPPSSLSSSVPSPSEDEEDERAKRPVRRSGSGWLGYFSVEGMGLEEYAEDTPSTSLGGSLFSFLPRRIARFAGVSSASSRDADAPEQLPTPEDEDPTERSEAERVFLTYSWWLLHEGWKGVGDRVHSAVNDVCGSMALKRSLGLDDWAAAIKEIRAKVETCQTGELALYDFTPHFLPSPTTPLPPSSPLPTHPDTSPALQNLLEEARVQLASPDARYLLDKGVSEMVTKMLGHLQFEGYATGTGMGVNSKRLVECLPVVNHWTKGVWEGVPDGGVEALLGLPEYESYAALIFGDWAGR